MEKFSPCNQNFSNNVENTSMEDEDDLLYREFALARPFDGNEPMDVDEIGPTTTNLGQTPVLQPLLIQTYGTNNPPQYVSLLNMSGNAIMQQEPVINTSQLVYTSAPILGRNAGTVTPIPILHPMSSNTYLNNTILTTGLFVVDNSPTTYKVPINRIRTNHATNPSNSREVKRSTHNASERRYRTSINDKINELKSMVVGEDAKLSKIAVLEKTIYHMRHLEKSKNRLTQELELAKPTNFPPLPVISLAPFQSSPSCSSTDALAKGLRGCTSIYNENDPRNTVLQMDENELIKLIGEKIKSFTDPTLQQEFANKVSLAIQVKQCTKRVFLPTNRSPENIAKSPPVEAKIICKGEDKTFTENQNKPQTTYESNSDQINYTGACSTTNMDDFNGKTVSNCDDMDYNNYSGKTSDTGEEINYPNNLTASDKYAEEIESYVRKYKKLQSSNNIMPNKNEDDLIAELFPLEPPPGSSTVTAEASTLDNYNVNNGSQQRFDVSPFTSMRCIFMCGRIDLDRVPFISVS